MPASNTTFAYGVQSRDTFGLDPKVFHVHVGVHRHDGGAITPAQLDAIKAALAPLAIEVSTSTGNPAVVAAHKAEAERQHKSMVAKVTGKKPAKAKVARLADQASGKPRKVKDASAKGRKASKAPTRKAARRA